MVLKHFSGLFESKNISITTDVKADLFVRSTQELLNVVLSNLITNAIKYTPDDGQVIFRIFELQNNVHLQLHDSGCGIPDKYKTRIFERFFRLAHPEPISGSGLGLALVKKIIEMSLGSIQVYDSELGGCHIEVILPKESPSVENANVELSYSSDDFDYLDLLINNSDIDMKSISEHTNNDDKPLLLIIEDNPDLRTFLLEFLSTHFICLEAKDGTEGIAKSLEYVPDLIISDLLMPGKNGLEVAKTIRADIRTSHIPLILLTAMSDIDTRKRAWQLEIDHFLAKPFDNDELLLKCNNLLNIRKLIGGSSDNTEGNSQHFIATKKKDEEFLSKLKYLLENSYSNHLLDVPLVAQKLYMSESQLQRKTKAILNQTVSQYIREFRIRKASVELLKGEKVVDVASNTGFSSSSYFTSCFKACYGMTPTHYVEKNRETTCN